MLLKIVKRVVYSLTILELVLTVVLVFHPPTRGQWFGQLPRPLGL